MRLYTGGIYNGKKKKLPDQTMNCSQMKSKACNPDKKIGNFLYSFIVHIITRRNYACRLFSV